MNVPASRPAARDAELDDERAASASLVYKVYSPKLHKPVLNSVPQVGMKERS